MSNYLGDAFYVLEYLGNPDGDNTVFTNLVMQENPDPSKSKPNYAKNTFEVLKEASKSDFEAWKYENDITVKQKILANIKKLIAAGVDSTPNRCGIPSLLPGNIGEKINSITVDIGASVQVPTAEIVFSNCNIDDLEAGRINDLTWHNRGCSYRVWMGHKKDNSGKLGAAMYSFTCVFEGYVLENKYAYDPGGVNVSLTLNSHKSAKAGVPLEQPIWNNCTTAATLIMRIAEHLGIPEDKVVIQFGDEQKEAELKERVAKLFGRDLTQEDIDNATESYDMARSFYNINILPKLRLLVKDGTYYPTPVMILNLLAREIGFIFRWHITTMGEMFFGIPLNPKIIAERWEASGNAVATPNGIPYSVDMIYNIELGKPPKKIFNYRPYFDQPIKALDYIDAGIMTNAYSDFYESIALGELERGTLPVVPEASFSTSETLNDNGTDAETPLNSNVTTTEGVTGEQGTYDIGMGSENGLRASKAGGIYMHFDGMKDFTIKDLTRVNAESFSLGTVSLTVSGCVPDPYLSILDTFEFRGYSVHSGRYLLTSITYKVSEGSRPTMELKGITSLSKADFTRRNSGSTAELQYGIPPQAEEKTGLEDQVDYTSTVEGEFGSVKTGNADVTEPAENAG